MECVGNTEYILLNRPLMTQLNGDRCDSLMYVNSLQDEELNRLRFLVTRKLVCRME